MASRAVRYDPIEGVENIAGYEEGGLRPTLIGDELSNGRFKIINKLGSGSYSTVWLAEDHHSDSCIALKIHRADHSLRDSNDKLMTELSAHQNDSRQFILLPTEHFFSESTNGRHRVEVYPVAGADAYHRIYDAEHGHLAIADAKRAILHATRGVEFLHSAGIGHGDIYSSNILQCMGYSSLPSDIKEKLLSCEPEMEAVSRLDGRALDDGVPEYAVVPLDMSVLAPHCHFEAMADLGCIFKPPMRIEPDDSEARNTICSPERLVGLPYGLPADIWSLGCTIIELLLGHEIFDTWPRSSNRVFRRVVELLGRPPQGIIDALPDPLDERELGGGVSLETFLSSARTGDEANGLPNREDELSEQEMAQVIDLVMSMLRYEPSERLTIAQVLDHAWMRSL